LGAYFAVPLMSRALVDALRASGVDNLEIYDAVIREERSGREHRDYAAVNVIGLVAMADPSRSRTESLEGLGTWVHELVVDEGATGGALLVRMREGPSKIVVHRSIKEVIEAKKLPLLRFVAMEGFAG
jgi:hypothetical protein